MQKSSLSALKARVGGRLIVVAWDSAAWALGLAAAAWFRYEGDLSAQQPGPIVQAIAVAVLLQIGFGVLADKFGGRHLVGAMDDVFHIMRVMGAVGFVVFIIGLTGVIAIPRSVPITATLVAIMLAAGLRVALRLAQEHRARPNAESAARVLIFGAGVGGQQLVRSMLSDAESGYLPIGLLDDDLAAQSRRISGVAVRGTRADIATVAKASGATLLVVAIRNLDVESMREISRSATKAGLRVQVIPSLMDLCRPWVGFSDLRDLDIADLLGRRPVEVDVTSIADYLAGKTVLVTGAGGSIGSELCRQVLQYGPGNLLMLDRDESALHALQLSIYDRAMLDSPDVILADIRDAQTITRIFAERRPHVVFHAAALKHLPMLEQYPHEAWKSNVLGTLNVLDAAAAAGVERFVNISTDKAANPISVLGRSKRIGERLVAHTATNARGTYLSVRFGNVLGSRGSVLTTFAEQIAADAPLTITHPDVTRFFMTIPEAVRLVIQAAAIGRPGEALVLDMGAPVRIADVARQLTVIAGRSVQILYTGLRDGEKLHEELFGDGEQDHRPVHPSVSHVAVPGLDPAWVVQPVASHAVAGEVMARLVAADGDIALAPASGSDRRAEETNASGLVTDQRSSDPEPRIHPSDDLSRIGESGYLRLIGGSDSQTKAHDYRSELGEIEAAINAAVGVQECATVGVELAGLKGTAICCAFSTIEGVDMSVPDVRRAAGRILPSYMVPAHWRQLDALPRKVNGKIDHNAVREHFRAELAKSGSKNRAIQ